jgi:hypothetical protein
MLWRLSCRSVSARSADAVNAVSATGFPTSIDYVAMPNAFEIFMARLAPHPNGLVGFGFT